MQAVLRFFLIPVLITVLHGCVDNKAHVTVSSKTFEISATIVPKFVKSGDRESKIGGTIIIKNVTSVPQKFSAKYLFLKINNDLTARTYKNSSVPDTVNTGDIDIEANSSVSFPAYWVYNVPAETKLKSLQFLFQESE
jgi:hypothetical protein